jgi:hypothetical protein
MLAVPLKQLISTEEFCAASPFLQTFPILQYVLHLFPNALPLQWALLYLRRSQKSNLDYHELKNLEANDG